MREPYWKPEEDEKLRQVWDSDLSLQEISQVLNRSRKAVYWRAANLGLGVGCYPSYEMVPDAAKRTGFVWETMKRIIAWSGLVGRPCRSLTKSYRCYNPTEIDQAVKNWMATEPLGTAAKRHNIARSTLQIWAMKAGMKVPPKTSGVGAKGIKSTWRVNSAWIDEVVNNKQANKKRRDNK